MTHSQQTLEGLERSGIENFDRLAFTARRLGEALTSIVMQLPAVRLESVAVPEVPKTAAEAPPDIVLGHEVPTPCDPCPDTGNADLG